jgi:archaeosine synthase
VRRFAERVIGRYVPPESDVTVLLPCSAKKPYSLSQSHRRFAQVINGRALELIVTSPLGLVPRELENIYPAAHYDVPVTGYWDAEEKAFISSVLARYFERHPESRYIAHLEGGALDVVMMAAKHTGTEVEITCTGHPTSSESLQSLEGALSGMRKVRQNLVRGTCSWQFDCVPDTKGMTIRGRYPEIAVMKNRTPLFTLDTGTGLLKPTFSGWEYISSGYRVYIDDFIPQGDILAPGVNGADPAIREGDEVLVIGPRALATGRASMNAEEMERSARGVAVRVRKIKNVKMQ